MKALCIKEKALLYDQIVALVEQGDGELLLGSSDDGAEHFESQKSSREIALSVVLSVAEGKGQGLNSERRKLALSSLQKLK
ncbi:TPA: hypothetical protein RQN23_000684 [Aeromonas veronii]|nr:hypothetical protein [Aeromonas veronii]